jgi:hypothetical protein
VIRVRVVSSPIETVLTVATVCAPMQVNVKVTEEFGVHEGEF